MRGLERKISIVDRAFKMRMRNVYNVYTHDIGAIIERLSNQIIGTISRELSQYDQLTYADLSRNHAFTYMRSQLDPVFKNASQEIESLWGLKRRKFDLATRVGMAYMDRKSSPPWIKVKINLQRKNSGDPLYHPKSGVYGYTLSNMLDGILQQVKRGALNGETSNAVIARVRSMFDSKTLKGVREASQYGDDLEVSNDNMDLYGPVDITTGVFDDNDIDGLNSEFRRLNLQQGREYQSWFTDAIKKNNRYLRDLEQNMMSDALALIQSGQNDSIPDLQGIEDMVWAVERPGVCPICDKRDRLTMTQIKAKMNDKYGSMPPPLHPWCRCELVPQMAKKWQDKDLSQQGVKWDPATGKLTIPKDVRDKYRLDLNFDDFLDYVSKGGGQ